MFINKMSVFLYQLAISYMVPLNMNIFWNFGVLGFFFLISQILTGMFLGMHYVPNLDLAFKSVEHIMRDVNFGWFISYLHSNGASMFFFVIYMHVFSGLFYNSYIYPSGIVWMIGIIMLLLMMLTAFLGYVLPWGQMSFWAATVMTNLASAVPMIGGDMVVWLWGGFSVGNPTLNSFFSLHYILPIVMLFLVVLHVIFLHFTLSSNPLGIMSDVDTTKFGMYFVMKDMWGMYLVLFICSVFLFFYPNVLSHSDNYIPANALVTPNHMVPEWYFLPFYAILSSVPNKLFGVVLLLASMLLLMMLPFMMSYEIKNTNFKPILSFFYFYFVFICMMLGWMGSKDIMEPFYEIGQISTIFYFLYFLVILPLIHKEV